MKGNIHDVTLLPKAVTPPNRKSAVIKRIKKVSPHFKKDSQGSRYINPKELPELLKRMRIDS